MEGCDTLSNVDRGRNNLDRSVSAAQSSPKTQNTTSRVSKDDRRDGYFFVILTASGIRSKTDMCRQCCPTSDMSIVELSFEG